MSEGFARVLSVVSIVFTIASLALAIVFARRKTRIRVGFDLARATVGVFAILVMAAVTNVSTSTLAVLLAVVGGLVLGFGQGAKLEITRDERGFHTRRSPVAIALWGAGIVIMQAAGLASRAGVVRLGQTIAWFSACLGIGLMAGRTGPVRRTAAGVGVAGVIAAIALPGAAFVAGIETPAAAQTTLTAEDLCAFAPYGTLVLDAGDGMADPQSQLGPAAEGGIKFCGRAFGGYIEDGQRYNANSVVVYLFLSESDAVAFFDDNATITQMTMIDAGIGERYMEGGTLGDLDFLAVGQRGPFVFTLYTWETVDVRAAMREIDDNIAPYAGAAASGEAAPTTTPSSGDVSTSPSSGTSTTSGTTTGIDGTGSDPGPGADEPIDPEEAARQAITGLIAAVAIGLITWGEATAEIANILSGLPGSGSSTGTVPTGFIDPYDQTPLKADPTTGMVFWPWDGTGGHWVEPSEVPTLLDDWNRELDSETARRVRGHDAQAQQDWDELRRRSKEDSRVERERLDAEAERRRKEQLVADRIRDIAVDADFDQMVSWLDKNPSPTSEQLDALRSALNRQIGARAAIDDLPDTGELLREAMSRTIGADSEWDKDHVTWADVADVLLPGSGTLLRNPEMTARAGAAMATGGWSEAAVIPFVDVPRALEEANAAREAAGLPDLTADEARYISNVTIIKSITIDQALERGLPLAAGLFRGGDAAARQAAQEALDASMRRGANAASDAIGTPSIRSIPGDEALGRTLDDTLPGRGPSVPEAPPPARSSLGDPAPPRIPDDAVVEPGAALPGRPPPPGAHPPPAARGVGDELVREAGARTDSIQGPGVQPPWEVDPKTYLGDVEGGPPVGRPPALTPEPEIGLEMPRGYEPPGGPPPAPPPGEVPGFGPEFGPRTTIHPVELDPKLLDVEKLPEPPSWVGEIEGVKVIDDLDPPTGPGGPPPGIDPPPAPPAAPPPVDPPSPSGLPEAPVRPPDQDVMEAALRGETPPGSTGIDDLELVKDDQFVGTGHAGQGGWSPEALLREERFWQSDGTPILGPEGVDVSPPPKGFILQVNPRTRTVTPKFGDALTETQKARLRQPGGPVDQLAARINKTLDDLGTPP